MLTQGAAARLQSQLDCLPVLLANAEAGAIERPPASGKWSARENLAHLARYQTVFLKRVNLILGQDNPFLARYAAEDDPEWAQWASLGTEDVLARLKAQRSRIIVRFNSLNNTQLSRVGTHSRLGPLTLAQWLEFFLLHEAHHLLAVLHRLREHESDSRSLNEEQ